VINIFGLATKLALTAQRLKSMSAMYVSVGSDLGAML
jgi:hypothetical protein